MAEPERRSSRHAMPMVYVASGVLAFGEGSVGIILPLLLDDRGYGPGLIGLVLSVYGIGSLGTRAVAGAVFTTARTPSLIVGGVLVTAASFALLPIAPGSAAVAALVAADGIGFSLATTGILAVIMSWRPEGSAAGSIMAWYTGTTGMGYAAAGFISGWLADRAGLAKGMLLLSIGPLLVSVPLSYLVRRILRSAAEPEPIRLTLSTRGMWSPLMSLPPVVWLAFAVTLYINLNLGVLQTFFPIHGVSIGLSLTEVGVLIGVHSFVAGAVRFLSGPLFRRISYEQSILVLVLTGSAAVVGIALSVSFALLMVLWSFLGLARGVLRVASGALVLDAPVESDRERAAASGVYLGGLDLGRIVGPLLGGGVVGIFGTRTAFLAVALAFPVLYGALSWRIGAGARPART